ncbi:MAG TPA: hypothetical protein VF585_02635 [Chthoniobacterales bacterium]
MKPDSSDSLESRLQELPLRSLPTDWRREILAAAEAKTQPSAFLAWLPGRWFTVPPAAAWVIIALLRIDTPPPEPFTGTPISPQAFAAAQEQKRLLLASLEQATSPNEQPPVTTWPFRFDHRPL